ncbi:multidrug resistance-associated protein 1-like [Bradysia coprophila]|uniref:multidrug resistance-associated protein 1-like n=1 Tax=Bradysia coprophila TaxID=38358 RepID=UPI00187D86ED|nr:multidrug resistance-associated protein 1-like [Bradysia coprophila]
MDEFCGSEFWNTNLTWHTNDPDLTLCFQKTILIWTPCLLLWLFLWLEIAYAKRSMNRNIPWGILNISKLIFTVSLILLTTSDFCIAVSLNKSGNIFPADYYTPMIKVSSFILSGFLVYLNKRNGLQSSGVLFLFWFFLFLFSIPQCRSEIRRRNTRKQNGIEDFWDDYNFVSFMVFYAITSIVFLLNCFADQDPQETKYPKTKKPCPESSSNFVSKLLFSWFDTMAWKGYKAPLTQDDLWDLKPEDTTTEIYPEFTRHWEEARNASVKRNGKSSVKSQNKASILPALFKTFWTYLLFGWLLKLACDIITFMLPQLLGLTIEFVDSSTGENRPEMWKGIMYAVLLFIVASLQSILFQQYFHRMYIIGFRIRTALISAIYRKALVISNATRKESTVGEITNLMSIDADRFTQIMLSIDLIWSAPLQIAIAMYFLWSMLGAAVLAGLAVMIVSMPITGILLNMMRRYFTKQMANKDERIKMMSEILNGIKVLKLYAWENSFQNSISSIRNKEVKTLRKSAYLSSFVNLIWFVVPYLVSLFTFGVFVLIDENNVLTPQIAFVSLNLFNIIRFPLILLPDLVSHLIQARVSITRINKFLNSEELDMNSIEYLVKENSPLLMENGTFSWNDEEEILSSINVRVETGSLVAVVGNVGSGKSSLLSAFLGEMNKISGRVHIVGTKAYVSQQAWIQNCTLRANILFGKPYNEHRYQKVIEACALKPDIEILPAGDLTEIGEKGINLSGGQKQRISLARAVYHDADIYLLDDPLSAVDAHVGQHIFEKVIGPTGMLASKTRVMVTHAINYLPKVDNIFVLENGKVSESGSYTTLLTKKGTFAEFLLQHIQEVNSDDEEIDDLKLKISKLEVIDDELVRKLDRSISKSSQKNDNAVSKSQITNPLSRQSSETSEKDEIPKAKDKLIDEEELHVGNVKYEVYKYYIKCVGIKWIVLMLLANIVFQSVSIGSNIWLSRWSSDSNAATDTQLRDTYLGVYGALGLLIVVSGFVLDLAPRLGGLVAGVRLHLTLLRGILRAPLSFFETTPTGRILSRFANDIDGIDNTLPEMLAGAGGLVFEVLGVIVVISISTKLFCVAIVPIAILYYFLQNIYISASRQLKRLSSVSRSPIYSHFGETLQGAPTIRSFSVQTRFINESDERVNANQASQHANIVANRWLGVRLEMVGGLIIFFAALFAVLNRDTISSGIAGLSIAYSLQITKSLNWLVRMVSALETEAVSVERLKEYSQTKSEAPWNIPSQSLPKNWPEIGTVQFNNFDLRYRDGLELSLKGLSFKINGGEKVGIVGRTGAGKSSLTLALFRIIESSGGSILIDGQDISQLGLHELRSRLTIIPQDPVLFSGTLRLNLDPFEQKSDDELWMALEHAHLKSFVGELTTGLNHEITEGGENLSVGQRQLVCLSRALLRKTKVLILDEATAAVDLETDELIQRTIRTEFNDCTILTIAHRLNTIMDSDKVIVLDKGQISEFASPMELLQDRASVFYGMAKESGLV